MATLNELIYDVMDSLNVSSDDTRFTEEHVAFQINSARNLLQKQALSNPSKVMPQEALQVICLDLTQDELCFDDINTMKSTVKVPATLENTGRSNLVKAYPSGSHFVKNWNIIDYSRLPFVSAEKYNGNQIFITVDPKSNVIVYNSDSKHLLLEKIELEGLFENPEEAYNLSCDNDGTDFWETQYPIDSGLIKPLKDLVLQGLIPKYKLPEDEINDGEDNIQIEDARRQRL